MRYYGNKTKLLPFITQVVNTINIPQDPIFVDLFAGTNSVGMYFKQRGFQVISNDIKEYSYAIAKSYIELSEEPSFLRLKDLLYVSSTKQINEQK